MKKFVKIVALIALFAALASFCLTGCDLTRKLGGAEMNFPSKVANAKSLSFGMHILYEKASAQTEIDMTCYKRTVNDDAEEYAYVYSTANALYDSYKNIYADQKLYETFYLTQNSGSYYVKEGVPVNDEGNLLYHVTQKILLTSVAALLSKAKKETIDGETAYRYDIDVSGTNVSVWYNSEVLVRLYAEFAGENGGEVEKYTFSFSDYRFDKTIASEVFAKPDSYGLAFVPSPMSFESWMEIITSFSGKLGK